MPSEHGWIVPRDAWGHRELGEAAGTGPGASVGVWHRGQAEGSGPSRPQNWERTRLCCSKPPSLWYWTWQPQDTDKEARTGKAPSPKEKGTTAWVTRPPSREPVSCQAWSPVPFVCGCSTGVTDAAQRL